MDFLMASGIFALVFVGVLLFTSSRGNEVEQQREVARRLTRPADEVEVDVMRKGRPEEGQLLTGLYNLNLARKLDLDPETCLHQANLKFERRFNHMEQIINSKRLTWSETPLEVLEIAWQHVKQAERTGSDWP